MGPQSRSYRLNKIVLLITILVKADSSKNFNKKSLVKITYLKFKELIVINCLTLSFTNMEGTGLTVIHVSENVSLTKLHKA